MRTTDCLRELFATATSRLLHCSKCSKSVPVCERTKRKISVRHSRPFSPSWLQPLSFPITLSRLPAVTKAAALQQNSEALEKEANRVAAQAENRTRGVRIVSANGRFAAHVQCGRFSAQFDGNGFAIELHE
jgi:hypothetical protein